MEGGVLKDYKKEKKKDEKQINKERRQEIN